MRVDLLQRARDTLPTRLNAGILFAEGGFCVLGWMLFSAGFHHITIYGNTIGVVDPAEGGPATEVVARVYGIPLAQVESLAQLNDATSSAHRVEAVAARLDELLAAAPNAG